MSSASPAPSLEQVVAVLDDLYPPTTAEGWDAVGLVAGDPAAPVRKVLFAVDPVAAVVDEALEWGADLVVTHHPLFLRGVHSVAATTFKGSVVHRLVSAGVGLHVAHTNADSAPRGVADALADLVGVVDRRPLVVSAADEERGIGRVGRLAEPVTLAAFAERVASALPATAQGIRVAGDLDAMVTSAAVVGGSGDSLFDAVRAAAADVYVTADLRHHPASELRERAAFEASRPEAFRPETRDTQEASRPEAREMKEASRPETRDTPFLVDVAHFASEWPWLAYAATDLVAALAAAHGSVATVETRVSTLSTDPWTARVASPGR
ncbi:Nif3-like dinuclear metal center hexameric protein [Antribacter gilvus]|uniref:Nif3-like dinuclear metal center hexameric protein n=1 Tax=Antribacter gilvus TaxID=2304675 RepID=UPI000F76DE51|nr:Nif3-like dinuclear metal center hexameric protein [Antribacter gilvus]